MTSRTSVGSLVAGFVLCCSLSISPVHGSEPTLQVVPAVRQVAEAGGGAPVTTVGWRHFGHFHSHGWGPGFHYHYHGWGRGIGWGVRHHGFYGSYPGFYYGGYAPYYYSAPVYRTTYYAPTYYTPSYYARSFYARSYYTPSYYAPSYYAPTYSAPSWYASSYPVGYAPVVYSYRPACYYTPSVRVLYGGYGYYYPGCY